jgi:hypothetical protein
MDINSPPQPRTSEPACRSETSGASDGPLMPFGWAIDAHGIGFIVGLAKIGRRSEGVSFRAGSPCRSSYDKPWPFFRPHLLNLRKAG